MTQLYTSSRLRVFRECPRKHRLRYVNGLITPQTPPMAFGTLVHKALEVWYRSWQSDGSPDLDRAIDACEASDEAMHVSEIDRIRARVIVAAYHARWSNEPWEILGVEVQFRYWLGNAEIGGKIDALVRDTSTDRIYVVEHKTSTADTSPGSLYWDRLAIDSQVSVYIDGAAAGLDYEIAGCIYDVLKRPLREPKLATPEESRKYTLGKGCKKCGGSAGGKRGIVRGKGTIVVSFVTTDILTCDECDGTGWRKNEDGVPEEPRLHSNQRDRDETLEEYEDRLVAEVSERVDEMLVRSTIVRLDEELPRMRQDLIDTIATIEALEVLQLAPPNHDACTRGRDACAFFAFCAGRGTLDDFQRGSAHPELAAPVSTSEQEAA